MEIYDSTEKINMQIYESTGKFNFNGKNKVAHIKTMLPNLKKGGKYQFVKYYNISSKDYFGLLGILSVEGENNVDLRHYDFDTVNLKNINTKPVNLLDYPPINGGKDFSTLQKTDKLYFMCFHDNNFKDDTQLIKIFQDCLPNFPIMIMQPKVGNGGILTFEELAE